MPRVPTEKDFEILLQDAEKSGALDGVVKEKKELVFNPLSFLRFDPTMNIAFKLKEELDPEFAKTIEPEGTVDFMKEVERAGIDGGVRLIKESFRDTNINYR